MMERLKGIFISAILTLVIIVLSAMLMESIFTTRKNNNCRVKIVQKDITNDALSSTTLNELRDALLIHPLKTWNLARKISTMKDIRVHEGKLNALIENRNNERLKRKLYKVLQGKDVYLEEFGGSNTIGGGMRKDEGGTEGIYPKVIKDWWDKTITPITGSHLKVRQIAMGGISSDFFQYCFASYIHKQLDLVFIEMAVNDLRKLPFNANKSTPLEQLKRQLLVYPTEPALVYINLFSGHSCNDNCANLQDYGEDLLSDLYNVTSLNWRKAVCSKDAAIKGCDVIASDGLHVNQLGHAHISLMVINLIRTILRDHIAFVFKNSPDFLYRDSKSKNQTSPTQNDAVVPRETSHQKVSLPSPVYIKKKSNAISEPLCWTSLVPHRQKNEIKNNLDIAVSKNIGFYIGGDKECRPPCHLNKHNNLTGYEIGASVILRFTVPARNSTDGIKTRSVIVSYYVCKLGGAVDIWMDGDYKKKKYADFSYGYGRTTSIVVATGVGPGEHSLNIKIVRPGKVLIYAVIIGPPDGPYSERGNKK